MIKNCKGNALLYVLIAVALIAALTYSISQDGRGQQQNQLNSAQVKLLATDLIKHAVAAEMAVHQMMQWGIDYDQILFDLPGTAGYSTNINRQIYHPSGGGLSEFPAPDNYFDNNGTTGWQFQGNNNIEWSSTTATDFIYSFINVDEDVCAQVNNQLRNDITIPISTVNFTNTFTEGGTNTDFIISECAACENVKTMCIADGTTNAFYTIIGSR